MFKSVSRLGAYLFSLFAAGLVHGDMPEMCIACTEYNASCSSQFGSNWYYCGTDSEGWYWCCPS